MFLIAVDAFSKWVEVYIMTSSYGSRAVIEKLMDLMSRVGIPHTIVTDNGTSFISQEFKDFCSINGITHTLTPVYHPSSNGQAESYVKIIKKGLKGIILNNKGKPLKERIYKFLFDYRNSKHSTTEKSPAELVYGRPLRARLDLLTPISASTSSSTCLTQTVQQKQCSQREYYKGKTRKQFIEKDLVWIMKNVNNKKFVWIKGVITRKIGNVMYEVYVPEKDRLVKRHLDQIRPHGHTRMSDQDSNWDSDIIQDVQREGATTSQMTPDDVHQRQINIDNDSRPSNNNSDVAVLGTPSPEHVTISPSVTSTPLREGEEGNGVERNVEYGTPLSESDDSPDSLTPIPAINPRRLELSPDNFTP